MTGRSETSEWLEAQALAGRLRDAGLDPAAVAKIAAAVFADPDRGHGGWAAATIAEGIVLWVHLPAVKAAP